MVHAKYDGQFAEVRWFTPKYDGRFAEVQWFGMTFDYCGVFICNMYNVTFNPTEDFGDKISCEQKK